MSVSHETRCVSSIHSETVLRESLNFVDVSSTSEMKFGISICVTVHRNLRTQLGIYLLLESVVETEERAKAPLFVDFFRIQHETLYFITRTTNF